MKRWVIVGGMLAAVFVAVAIGYAEYVFWGPPVISVHNGSHAPIRDLVLSGSGFSEAIPVVEPGKTISIRVRPRGESGLALRFRAEGRTFQRGDLSYLEPHGGYRVRLEVNVDFSVHVEERLTLSYK